MNREIKFRAWDQKDKKYLLPEKQGFVILPIMPSFGVTLPYGNCSNPGNIDEDCIDWADADLIMGRYELEQYTGLKDKNGKEIYEGDIVKCEGSGAVIIWRGKNAEFGIRWLDCGVEDELDYWNDIRGPVEVIGNVHENPELLGGEK